MTTFRGKSLIMTACSATLIASALVGCSSSGGHTTGGSSVGTLSKAEFIAQANTLCMSTHAEFHAAQPSSAYDYPGIVAFIAVTSKSEPIFLGKVTALVDKSPDKAALHKNWIDVDRSQFNAQKPVIAQLDAAARAKDYAQMSAVVQWLRALAENSKTPNEIDYLNKYGLTACASLTANGSE